MAVTRKTTREFILEAFEAQLKTTPFENIRVASICQECGIQRPHFYYYFNDKYDLSYCYFIEKVIKTTEETLAAQGFFQTILEANSHVILENKLAYQHLMRYRGSASLFSKMSKLIYDTIKSILESWNPNLTLTNLEAEHLNFYCHAVSNLALTWYMEDMTASPEILIRLICNNIPDDLKKYFR